jgi:hypothetical protein
VEIKTIDAFTQADPGRKPGIILHSERYLVIQERERTVNMAVGNIQKREKKAK